MTPKANQDGPFLPTETEIYILPTGEIVVADLPAELATSLAQFAHLHAFEHSIESVEPVDPSHVTHQQHPIQST